MGLLGVSCGRVRFNGCRRRRRLPALQSARPDAPVATFESDRLSVSARPSSPSVLPPFPWVGLLTLAGAIFVSVTSEFLPTGLLPDMAAGLGVGVATTGLLVSIFAGAVVVATTPLATLTRRFSRKRLVVLVLAVVAVANVLAGLAPNFGVLVGARILGGAAHGLFWGVVATYPAYLVAGKRLGRAIAITAAGGSAAFVLGVPLGTAIGHALGWRAAFLLIGAIVLVLALVVVVFLPPVQHRQPLATGEIPLPVRDDRSMRPVVLLCVAILMLLIGQNTLSTYVAPWLIGEARLPAASVPMLLFLFGGAGAVGLVLAGLMADRFPKRGFVAMVLLIMVSVLVLALAVRSTPVELTAFAVWGAAFGGLPAMLQTRMMRTASPRTRDVAGALQTTAFNVGIGGGALLGSVLLGTAGLGALPVAMVLFLAVGLVLAFAPDLRRFGTRRLVIAD
jgi:predicted MFS family arabinose efflux permease